ncbi:MAG TPA: sensor domain-containing diguanylate cyclase [Elusimicrobiota bacterium]|nr:sensor domain-containing diguanylate cyclase [Elusimicrobiota bacterium]
MSRHPVSDASTEREWFERIARLSVDLVTIFDAERLLQKIMEIFAEVGKVSKGSLMVPTSSGDRLEIRASVGLSERAREIVRPRLGEGVAGRVAAGGKPILLEDTSVDDGRYLDFLDTDRRPRPKETLLSLPLVYRDQVLGVVNLDHKLTGEPFRREDMDRLTVLCNFAAVAIANQRFYQESLTDGLTGLVAQKTFKIRLQEEVSRARRYSAFLSVLFLDLDHFKRFNDTHGHPLGDQALRHLARLLRESTRSIDVVGRCGGEEFGILLLETDLPSARVVGERIRSRVESTPLSVEGSRYPITVSIGAAALSPSERVLTPEALLGRADDALYSAKGQGRNRLVLWQENIPKKK